MANSMYSINNTYNKYINNASDLESAARKLDSLSNDLTSTINNIKNNWQAQASSDFQAKCVRERDKIRKSAQDLRDTARALRTMAGQIKRTEIDAYETAKRMDDDN